MGRLPDVDAVLATLRAVASPPTAPFHEGRVLNAIRRELEARGLAVHADRYGQLFARRHQGASRRALVLVAHTDHPAFDVVSARGTEGRVRVRGGLEPRCFASRVPVVVHHDDGRAPFAAVLDDFVFDLELTNSSPGHTRIRAERPLEAGMWAVMDIPSLERRADELAMRAADDLALCALSILTLEALAAERAAFDVHAVFTRAEEPGLFGARLIAAEGGIPADAYVVSLEASRALQHAPAGRGIVIRVGDFHNTFSNQAERYLRVAQERLFLRGIPTQRALLTGGTCEASAFVRLGWTATGVALPNTNYHNAGPEDRFVPEVVRLSDLMSGIALLVEATTAAGADESETWWPTAERVPDDIAALMRDTAPASDTEDL
ncbi:MAG: hypothetical protein M3O91_08990 [Chloroflexota bacterium]|nr:hypothetical protein [Chloroflexota bacterium]